MKDTAIVNLLISNLTNCDLSEIEIKRATYLAEELFLSHFRDRNAIKSGVIELLTHYADIYLKDDPCQISKRKVLELILKKGKKSKNNTHYAKLKALLIKAMSVTYKSVPFDPDWVKLEDTNEIVQCGKILFLPPNAEVYVIGDSHGDLRSISRIIKNKIKYQCLNLKPYIVFLGDYVNNGLDSIGTLQYVLDLKETYSDKVVLLNGNHEFKETYLTAFKEFFITHWDNYRKNPHGEEPPEHYGHIRFDLIKEFGIEKGEEIYRDFEQWGLSLPYICLDAGRKLMISHSLGKAKGSIGQLTFDDLVNGKDNEAANLWKWGYEAWKQAQETTHSAMVNNRSIDANLIKEFNNIGIGKFIIGHTHYKSGIQNGVNYICSSHMDSPDAGHYMYQEMVIESNHQKLNQAYACFAHLMGNNIQIIPI